MLSQFGIISYRYKWDYLWILILLSITIIFSTIFYEDFNASTFAFDSTLNINVANNLLEGNGYVFNFVYDIPIFDPELGYAKKHSDIETLMREFPDIHNPYGRAPLYDLILAGFFKIFSANPENWVFYGAVLSIIISIFFIITYYVFCRKYFGFYVAIFSSLIIVTSMTYLHFLTTTRLNPLLWMLITLSFLFLNKTTRDFILFGIITGLATLTHPIGIVSGVSYLSYLIIKKQFKGFILIMSIWFTICLPWLIRQFEVFNNFGFGYSLPFSKNISQMIRPTTIPETDTMSLVGNFFFSQIPTPFEFLNSFFLNSPWIRIFNSELIIFFLFFIIFSFLSLQYISKNRQNFKLTIIVLSLAVISIFLFHNFYSNIFVESIHLHIFEISIIVIFPIISIFLLNYITKGKIFIKKIPNYYFIFIIYGGFMILGGYYSLHSTITINHFVMFPFLLILLPLGIYGWKNFVKELSGFNNNRSKNIVFLVSISLLISVPTAFFIPENIHFYLTYSKLDDDHLADAYSWFRENTERKQVLANLELPSILFLKTGNPTVIIPEELRSLQKFDLEKTIEYINFYNIDYMLVDQPSTHTLFLLDVLNFEPIFECGSDCVIFKNKLINDSWYFTNESTNLDESSSIFSKNNSEMFEKSYDELILKIEQIKEQITNLKLERESLKNEYEFKQNLHEKLESEINNSDKLSYQKLQSKFALDLLESELSYLDSKLEKNKLKIRLFESEINFLDSYFKPNHDYDVIQNYDKLKEIFIKESEHKIISTKIAIANHTANLEYQKLSNLKSTINNMINYIRNENYDEKNIIQMEEIKKMYDRLINNNINHPFFKNYRSLFNEIIEYEINPYMIKLKKTIQNNIPSAEQLEYYDKLIFIYPNNIDFYQEKLNLLKQINSSPQEFIDTYDAIISIDRFNFDAWYNQAQIFEQLGRINSAINAYDFALKISPENKQEEIISKISELETIRSSEKELSDKLQNKLNTIKDIVKQKYPSGIDTEESKKMYVDLLKQEIDDWNGDSTSEVLVLYDELLKYDNDPNVWRSKALLLEQSGKISEAIELYKILMNLVSPEESRELYQKVQELQKKLE